MVKRREPYINIDIFITEHFHADWETVEFVFMRLFQVYILLWLNPDWGGGWGGGCYHLKPSQSFSVNLYYLLIHKEDNEG